MDRLYSIFWGRRSGFQLSRRLVRLNMALSLRYVEVHMEQGPILEAAGMPLGIVAGIAGQTRLFVMMTGTQVCIKI